MFLTRSSYMGQGVTRSRAIAHVRTNLPLNPSARTYRSKAGMAASSSSASPSTDSSTEQTQQAGASGATSAAGMQQFFDAWMNAWRSLGRPPGATGLPFQMPQTPPMPHMALPQMPSFPGMPDFTRLAAGALPSIPSLGSLNWPPAAIPAERLQKLQSDYSRDAMQLIQQAATSVSKAPELK